MSERTCAHCGCELPPKARRYCKDPECVRQRKAAYMREFYRQRNGRTEGGCAATGCDKPVRAKGLCVTHYNRNLAQRHPKVTVACTYCGQLTEKMQDNRRPHRFCSLICRDLWRLEQTNGDPMAAARAAVAQRSRDRKAMEIHRDPWPVWGWCDLPAWAEPDPRPRFTAGRCPMCGDGFVADRYAYDNGTSRYCSPRCTRAAGGDRRRARQRGAYVADVYRREVFERDGWRCQLCRRKVSETARAPHPRAATIDHIIPLALGGTHEPVNCQTACFECNCRKSHVGVGDQLRLIA